VGESDSPVLVFMGKDDEPKDGQASPTPKLHQDVSAWMRFLLKEKRMLKSPSFWVAIVLMFLVMRYGFSCYYEGTLSEKDARIDRLKGDGDTAIRERNEARQANAPLEAEVDQLSKENAALKMTGAGVAVYLTKIQTAAVKAQSGQVDGFKELIAIQRQANNETARSFARDMIDAVAAGYQKDMPLTIALGFTKSYTRKADLEEFTTMQNSTNNPDLISSAKKLSQFIRMAYDRAPDENGDNGRGLINKLPLFQVDHTNSFSLLISNTLNASSLREVAAGFQEIRGLTQHCEVKTFDFDGLKTWEKQSADQIERANKYWPPVTKH